MISRTSGIAILAKEAKKRLSANNYKNFTGPYAPPKDATPAQKEIYVKIVESAKSGEEIVNPIKQFADEERMQGMTHIERQRYILSLAADYAAMKSVYDERMAQSADQSAG